MHGLFPLSLLIISLPKPYFTMTSALVLDDERDSVPIDYCSFANKKRARNKREMR